MLIVYKFNFELTIIGILLILRRGEEVHDVVFGKQGTAQNSHDLHDWTSKLEVVLNDSDETVCDDGNMNLNTHGIVALSPERLDSKMLLDPFEEQFDLPPVFINVGFQSFPVEICVITDDVFLIDILKAVYTSPAAEQPDESVVSFLGVLPLTIFPDVCPLHTIFNEWHLHGMDPVYFLRDL